MQITVEILPQNKIKKLKIKKNAKIIEVLKKLEINPDIVVVFRKNSPLPIDEVLNENDRLKIVRVVSGG